MELEVEKLLAMGVIEKYCHEQGEVITPVFLVEIKLDVSYRLI